jgi:AcrR family transcriptional regulator
VDRWSVDWNSVPVIGAAVKYTACVAAETARLRDRRSQLTREEVLAAARRLFAERGYAGTSVRDIAREAGVSPQTVYDSIGSKSELVARLNDLIDAEAGIPGLVGAMSDSDDPEYVAANSARVTRAILGHCGDILRVLVAGAAGEPDLVRVLEEGHRRHVAGARQVVERLHRLRALPRRTNLDEAGQLLAAMSDVRIALVLHDGYGWPLDRVEGWIASESRRRLLGA